MYPSLIAERFTLRPLRDADAAAIAAACVDPEIVRWCKSIPLSYTLDNARLFIDYTRVAASNGSELVWAIDYSGVFAGVVTLFDIEHDAAEVGFWMAPQMRGKGILKEALAVMMGFAFDPQGIGLNQLTWTAIEGNTASEKAALAVGFAAISTVPEGTFDRRLPSGEQPRLTARTATMTRAQWAEKGFPV